MRWVLGGSEAWRVLIASATSNGVTSEPPETQSRFQKRAAASPHAGSQILARRSHGLDPSKGLGCKVKSFRWHKIF